MTAARVRLPGGVGPAERSVPALLVHLAGRRGRVTVHRAHVGAVTCLSPAVVLRALDRLLALGLLTREGPTLVLTTPAGVGGRDHAQSGPRRRAGQRGPGD